MFFKRKNTPDRGQVRFIVFEDNGTWYGVALELNLVVDAENQSDVLEKLTSAVMSYIRTTRVAKIRHSVLNQKVNTEYAEMWNDLEAGRVPHLKRITADEDEGAESRVRVANYGFIPQFAQ